MQCFVMLFVFCVFIFISIPYVVVTAFKEYGFLFMAKCIVIEFVILLYFCTK